MALTVQRIGEHAAHALGAQGDIEPVELANLAGEAWVNAHPWQYLLRRSKTIDTVASQSYVDLGDEVRGIVSMYPTSSLTNHVHWTGLEEINRLRNTVNGSYTGYWASPSYRRDSSTGALHQTAELWPTPSSSTTGYFNLMYHSGWLPVSQDDDRVDLPTWMEPTFLQWCRAYAEGLEDSDIATVEVRLEAVLGSQMMQRAMSRDGAMLGNLGLPHGGCAQPSKDDLGRIYVVDTVASPSSSL